MSILVIGANGGVGRHLVRQLDESDTDFTAGVRKVEQEENLKADNIKAQFIDVEKESIDELTEKFRNFEQVVFSVGSGASTGPEKTISVDLDGAVKAVKASKQAGVAHFVMVSTWDSRREAFDTPDAAKIKPYSIAKHHADEYLKHSGQVHSIVHPGKLTDNPGTGKVEAGLYLGEIKEIAREDVAGVISEIVRNSDHWGKELQIVNGDTDISEAVNNFIKSE